MATSVAVPMMTHDDASSFPKDGAHVKLAEEAILPQNEEKDSSFAQTLLLHTYQDSIHNISLSGLNVSKRKFSSWVNYTISQQQQNNIFDSSLITTQKIVVNSLETRQELRHLWKQQRLLTDRTEVLAVYKSDSCASTQKRGGFPDLLHIYADRLSAMIKDEVEEEFHIAFCGTKTWNRTGVEETNVPDQVLQILNGGLYGWLQRDYGKEETTALCLENIQDKTRNEQHAVRINCGECVFVDFFSLSSTMTTTTIKKHGRSFNTF